MTKQLPLSGLTILVTRPIHQAGNLSRLLEEQGAQPLLFPVIEIAPPEDIMQLQQLLTRINEFDLAIFVSRNAVTASWNLITAAGGLPSALTVAVIGKGSAQELALLGKHADLIPAEGVDSEALLKLQYFNAVRGKKIIIFRGSGGREKLATELINRGACVTYAEVYRRIKPANINIHELLIAIHKNKINFVIITSAEGLANLWELITPSGQHWLQHAHLIVFSARIKHIARELGMRGIINVTNNTDDQSVLETIISLTTCRRQ